MASTFFSPHLAPHSAGGWRATWHRIVFHHDTPAGLHFDIALIWIILASVAVTIADSVGAVHRSHSGLFYALEWGFTVFFLLELALRLLVLDKPMRYVRSALGVIDILAILPAFVSLVLPGSQYLLVVRLLRVLRIFRLLKLSTFLNEANVLVLALSRSSRKIGVFFFSILIVVTIFGSLMYVVEGPEHGFTSIPVAMYWAVVTVSTVGYGDVTPGTPLGQMVSSLLMLIGYSVIAVPTGIYAAEIAQTMKSAKLELDLRECGRCGLAGHSADARYCRRCGERLDGG
ncbi:MAG: ion transporter [Arenimonas sp.]|nr:ion transporter [Arenimonas sp.]